MAEGGIQRTLFERLATPIAASRPGAWYYVNVAPYLDRGLYRLTGGRLTLAGFGRVGFLKVKGAKTGAERLTPLVFTRDGDNILLVASRGGDVRHPGWYHNLVANPDVTFTIQGKERSCRARLANSMERPWLWKAVNRTYAGYDVYQRRAGDREIPVFVLEPRE